MTRVIMFVIWACIRCHPPVWHHETDAEMSQARCLHIRRELAAVSQYEKRRGFPTWTPISAGCMILP